MTQELPCIDRRLGGDNNSGVRSRGVEGKMRRKSELDDVVKKLRSGKEAKGIFVQSSDGRIFSPYRKGCATHCHSGEAPQNSRNDVESKSW
jgi:hypothetical protein